MLRTGTEILSKKVSEEALEMSKIVIEILALRITCVRVPLT